MVYLQIGFKIFIKYFLRSRPYISLPDEPFPVNNKCSWNARDALSRGPAVESSNRLGLIAFNIGQERVINAPFICKGTNIRGGPEIGRAHV